MKLLLSCLLLASLCALSSWSTPVVTQTPDVSVKEGETANITCCWTVEYERMTVNWLKHQRDVKSENFQKKHSGSLQKETSECTHFIIPSFRREDSGRYTCKLTIEIPGLIVFEGNGTVITATAKENTTNSNITGDGLPGSNSHFPALLVIISLAVVAPLLLIILVWFYKLRRRRASAARVIYEVPHTDSEVADMDKHSTNSSRGSSQWCQVPVYESFDYFEHVQTKESG